MKKDFLQQYKSLDFIDLRVTFDIDLVSERK